MKLDDFDKSKTYLVAVSYGPDSMALLNMLMDKEFRLVVCFVNYHTREESELEEKGIIKFCHQNHITLQVLDTSDIKREGNFEAWARKVRYEFFAKEYREYNASGIFIAHHLDDLIETYLMQVKRHNYVSYYGIKEVNLIMGMRVIRPLLDYRKVDLQKYCDTHEIPYSIDYTNLDDSLTRNNLRIHIVSKMKQEQIQEVLEEIKMKNEQLRESTDHFLPLLDKSEIQISDYMKLTEVEKNMFLHDYIIKYVPLITTKLSISRINEIKKLIISCRPNLRMLLKDNYYFVKEYKIFKITQQINKNGYEFHIDKPMKLETPYFVLDLIGDTRSINVFDYSYPLTVRNALPGDKVRFGKIHKSVNRLFINQKIPASKRVNWPVLLDRNGKIVYIPLNNDIFKINMVKQKRFVVK